MGSVTDLNAGDWKGGHMRIDSNEHTQSSDSGRGDEIELHDHDKIEEAAPRRPFPRLGLDALIHESRPDADNANEDGTYQFYRVYKRRWFGLVQLTLLNIIVSWDVSLIPNQPALSFSLVVVVCRHPNLCLL